MREIHVYVYSKSISDFMEKNQSNDIICFRCGQVGHMRNNCLTFKVRTCIKFENGECDSTNCSFAHGEEELRSPWEARCVRVVKQDGKFICIGCNSLSHTFRRCPLYDNNIMF